MDEEKNEINLDNIAEGLGGGKKEKEMPEESLSPENQPIPQVAPKEESVQEEAKPAAAPLEDIFSETEVEKPAALQPKQEEEPVATEGETRGPGKRKLVLLIVVLLLFAGVVALGYFGYNYYTTNNNSFPFLENIMDSMKKEEPAMTEEEVIETEEQEEAANVNLNQLEEAEETGTEPEDEMISSPMLEPFEEIGEGELDTDGDGLSDQDEIVRGMDINSNDSDSDGLYDREEVMVYNTDPINPDTDGDGFKDGAEVERGYNPKGPGKLYDINR